MSSRQKVKGYRFEKAIKDDLREAGLGVERLGQANQADLVIDGFGTVECKCFKQGLKFAYKYLDDNEAVIVKWQGKETKGKEPIVFIRYECFKDLLKGYLKE
jgi:hypothetical protein